jgi:hypothetical protein
MKRLLAVWHRITRYRFKRWSTIDAEFHDLHNDSKGDSK